MAEDSVFANLKQAMEEAALGQQVQLTPAVTGRQLCYYVGPLKPPPDAPPNLLHVPLANLSDYVATSTHRVPTSVVPSPEMGEEYRKSFANAVVTMLQRGLQERGRAMAASIARCRNRIPSPSKKLRIFAQSSRETTVMQYSSRGLIDAFERLGHEVRFEIESNDMQRLHFGNYVEAVEAMDPHIVVNVNHPCQQLIPLNVVNVVWWQDLMPLLRAGKPVPWRPNDLVYTVLSNHLAPALRSVGLPENRLQIQPFCIDTHLFRPQGEVPREEKVVFVGSSARIRLSGTADEQALVRDLLARVESGEAPSETEVGMLAKRHHIDSYVAFHKVFYYVMRDLLVRWLCQIPGIRVEVYGRYWDQDPVVAPFFKGEVPHGKAVANIYCSASHVLILHPLSINSQRLAEAAACGAIPVVYDCRVYADPPFWEDRLLYFRTRSQLAECLQQHPPTYAEEFRNYFSYERFAERIIADAAPFLGA